MSPESPPDVRRKQNTITPNPWDGLCFVSGSCDETGGGFGDWNGDGIDDGRALDDDVWAAKRSGLTLAQLNYYRSIGASVVWTRNPDGTVTVHRVPPAGAVFVDQAVTVANAVLAVGGMKIYKGGVFLTCGSLNGARAVYYGSVSIEGYAPMTVRGVVYSNRVDVGDPTPRQLPGNPGNHGVFHFWSFNPC